MDELNRLSLAAQLTRSKTASWMESQKYDVTQVPHGLPPFGLPKNLPRKIQELLEDPSQMLESIRNCSRNASYRFSRFKNLKKSKKL